MPRHPSVVEQPVTALLIAESFVTPHPLQCMGIASALLPLCGIPAMDLLIEVCRMNGIKDLIVIAYESGAAVEAHLHEHHGLALQSSSCVDTRITFRRGSENVITFPQAMADLRQSNVMGSGHFLLLSMDTLTNATCLRELLNRHRERVAGNKRLALTMIASSQGAALASAFDDALRFVVATRGASGDEGSSVTTPNSINAPACFLPPETEPIASYPPLLPHFSVCYDPHTQVVENIVFWEQADEGTAPPTLRVDIGRKPRLIVRSDLVFTGMLIIEGEALSMVTHFLSDVTTLIRDTVNSEVSEHAIAIDVLPPKAVVVSVASSVRAYVDANVAFADRLLYPLTHEADVSGGSLHVSRLGPTVYTPEGHDIAGVGLRIAHSTTVCENCSFGENVIVTRSFIGPFATLGPNCVLSGVVMGERVVLRGGVKVTDSVIGAGAILEDDVVVGSHCVIPPGTRVPAGTIVPCESTLRADGGTEEPFVDASKRLLPLVELFIHDPRQDAPEEEEIEDEHSVFCKKTNDLIERLVQGSMQEEAAIFGLSNLRTHHGKNNADLLRVVTQGLIQQISSKIPDGIAALEAFSRALRRLRAVFDEFTAPSHAPDHAAAMDAVLEGYCLGLWSAPESEPQGLALYPVKALAAMYYTCDEDLFEERGYCVVSADALVAFDDYVAELGDDSGRTDVESVVTRGWIKVKNYIEKIRSSME